MEQFKVITQKLAPELAMMNDIMALALRTDNPLMNRIVEEYLRTKGKQIRPILVMLSAKLFGGVNTDVLHAGAALEMLHNASLIHDDVVDETVTRRSLPTVNALWGNHIAVLVGDFFVSNALSAGIKTGNVEVVEALSALGQELSLGEIEQICNVKYHHFDEESYFSMIRKKTASLFRNCVRLGARTAGASPQQSAKLVEYAELLGVCFQIRDDIFDYYGDKTVGKPTGNDLREGKVTLPLLYALSHGPQDQADRIRALLTESTPDQTQISQIIEFAKANGGIDYAYARMRDIQRQADPLLQAYPDSEWKQAFRDLFDFIIERHA